MRAEEKVGSGRKRDFRPGDRNVDGGLIIFVKTQRMLLDALVHIFIIKKNRQ
jgi:hypothetical protein